MKTSHFERYAIVICMSVTALSGCAGSANSLAGNTPPAPQTVLESPAKHAVARNVTRAKSEMLIGSYVQITHSGANCKSVGPSSTWTNSFITFGNATGVVQGEYKGSGQWTATFNKGVETWNFTEAMTIRAGTNFTTVNVTAGSPAPAPHFTCHPHSFGPAVLKYTVQGSGGKIHINSLKSGDFNEDLLHFGS